MLIAEAEAFVREQIIPRWPRWKRNGVVVSDFVRQLKKLDSETALEAIIRCKETSTTFTWPNLSEFRKHISAVIKENHTPTTHEEGYSKWIDCYALNDDTGKYVLLCQPSALSEEGLKAGFAHYLLHWDLDPTDYRLNPQIAERTEKIRAIVAGGGKIISDFGNVLPEYNPEVIDDIPF
jgi:hypothetical protein